MWKITLTKSVTRIYNLGSYENYQPHYSMTIEVDGTDEDVQAWFNYMTETIDWMLVQEKEKLNK